MNVDFIRLMIDFICMARFGGAKGFTQNTKLKLYQCKSITGTKILSCELVILWSSPVMANSDNFIEDNSLLIVKSPMLQIKSHPFKTKWTI